MSCILKRIRVACIATLISAALLLALSTGSRADDALPQDETIAADKNLIALGEIVTFHIEPKPSISTDYVFVFDFGDGSPAENHKDTDLVPHRYKSGGTFNVSVKIQTPPGIPPYEAENPPSIKIEVQQVKVSADPLKVEVGIPVTFTATSVSKDPRLRYRFTFDNKKPEPTPQWQESNTAVHAYSTPNHYQARVEVGFPERGGIVSVDQSDSQIINVTEPPPGALVFHVPPKINENEPVTLSAEFPANGRHIQYRFVFDDGTASTWQDDASVPHTYREGTYHPYVEVGVLLDQTAPTPTPLTIATSPRQPLVVVPVATEAVSPTQPTNNRGPSGETDWRQYLVPILIGFVVLLVLVIFTVGGIGAYKAVKWAFAPRPTFVPHIDPGRAELAQGSAVPLIEFELHLDPNAGNGSYEIIKSGPALIGTERSQA